MDDDGDDRGDDDGTTVRRYDDTTIRRYDGTTVRRYGGDVTAMWRQRGEMYGHRIRMISPDGIVSILAGSGEQGFADGRGAAALFNEPRGLAIGPDGALFVADCDNHGIRRVDRAGNVTTVAGGPNNVDSDDDEEDEEDELMALGYGGGFRDGPIASARFHCPFAVAAASDGVCSHSRSLARSLARSLSAADTSHAIRRLLPQLELAVGETPTNHALTPRATRRAAIPAATRHALRRGLVQPLRAAGRRRPAQRAHARRQRREHAP